MPAIHLLVEEDPGDEVVNNTNGVHRRGMGSDSRTGLPGMR